MTYILLINRDSHIEARRFVNQILKVLKLAVDANAECEYFIFRLCFKIVYLFFISGFIIAKALILECFKTLQHVPYHLLFSSLRALTTTTSSNSNDVAAAHSDRKSIPKHIHPIKQITHLLTGPTPTSQYLFLRCLSLLDVRLWAGVGADDPGASVEDGRVSDEEKKAAMSAVLDKWEVEKIIVFMGSDDAEIRKLVSTLKGISLKL